MIVFGERLRHALQVSIDAELGPAARFIGRAVEGQAVAVFGFDSWTGEDCEVSMAAMPGGVTRGLLRLVAQYSFEMLGCKRITCRVKASNGRMVELMHRLGFTLEGRLREAVDGVDVLVFGMLKRECKWVANPQRCRKPPTRQ